MGSLFLTKLVGLAVLAVSTAVEATLDTYQLESKIDQPSDGEDGSRQANHRQLEFDGTLRATQYRISMFDTTGSTCIFPQAPIIVIECGEGGRIVTLENDESFGLATCNSVSMRRVDCFEDNPDYGLGGGPNVVVQCEGTTAEAVRIEVFVDAGTVDCSGSIFGVEAYSRTLSVSRVCHATALDGVVRFEQFFELAFCTAGSDPNSLGGCIASNVCSSLDEICGPANTLPALGFRVDDSNVPADCLEPANPPSTSVALGGNFEATYEIGFLSSSGDVSVFGESCSLPDETPVVISCGAGGTIGVAPESQAALDSGICIIQDTSTMACSYVATPGTQTSTLLVTCTGTTSEATSIATEWDPQQMFCTLGDGFASVSYAISTYQFCEGRLFFFKDVFIGEFASIDAARCSPVTASNLFGVDVDTDGEFDGVLENCFILRSSCAPAGACAADGSQPIEPLRARIDAGGVDTSCLVAKPPLGGGGFGCFSGSTMVQTKRGDTIRMDQVQLGDEVLTASGKFEAVYSFGHFHDSMQATYVQFLPSMLELSADHMVFLMDETTPVPASMVRVGDSLAPGGETVTSINSIVRNGVYAPFTPSGTLIVNGIAASSYIALQEDSATLKIAGISTGLSFQWLAHTFQFPQRIWCHTMSCTGETYGPTGVSTWVQWPHETARWIQSSPHFARLVGLPILAFFVIMAFLEQAFMHPAAAAVTGYLGWRMLSRTKQL